MNTSAAAAPIKDQFAGTLNKSDAAPVADESTLPRSLYSLVAQQSFFTGLSDHQLQLLTDAAMEIQSEPGQSIFQEGSPASRFYFLLEGRVLLELEVAGRGTIPI
jgi:CRP-like cAMP-binding protein